MFELKYDTVSKKNDNDFPGRAGHWDLHLPDQVSYLPWTVGQSLLSYPDVFFSFLTLSEGQIKSKN